MWQSGSKLAPCEDVGCVPASRYCEQVAFYFGVPRHGLPVDIIAKRLGDGGRFLGHFL